MIGKKFYFTLEGPKISELETLVRDLKALKLVKKDLNRVNHGVKFVISDTERAINEVRGNIQAIAGTAFLKQTEKLT